MKLLGADAPANWAAMGARYQREWLWNFDHLDARDTWTEDEARAAALADPETLAAVERARSERAEALARETTALLEAVVAVLRRFILWSSSEQADFVALWVLHTHVFALFDATPYLDVHSSTKRAGKSRLVVELLPHLVARPWPVVEPSEAVLFRQVDKVVPTLLVDEVDATFGKDSKQTEGLRAIFDVGYKVGAKVPRCVGNTHEVRDFDVYCPKAFAGLAGLPDTVRDRSARVELRRRARHEPKPERLMSRRLGAELGPLAARLQHWAEEAEGMLAGAEPVLPEVLSDRAMEVCEVVAAIADLAAGEWPTRARRAFLAVMPDEDDGDRGVFLLSHCRDAFDADDVDRLPTTRLLRLLVERGDESPWAGWWGSDVEHGDMRKPAMRLAQLLKPFGVGPKTLRLGQETSKGYERAFFADAWARFLPSPPVSGEKVVTSLQSRSDPESVRSETSADQGRYDVTTISGVRGGSRSKHDPRDPPPESVVAELDWDPLEDR